MSLVFLLLGCLLSGSALAQTPEVPGYKGHKLSMIYTLGGMVNLAAHSNDKSDPLRVRTLHTGEVSYVISRRWTGGVMFNYANTLRDGVRSAELTAPTTLYLESKSYGVSFTRFLTTSEDGYLPAPLGKYLNIKLFYNTLDIVDRKGQYGRPLLEPGDPAYPSQVANVNSIGGSLGLGRQYIIADHILFRIGGEASALSSPLVVSRSGNRSIANEGSGSLLGHYAFMLHIGAGGLF